MANYLFPVRRHPMPAQALLAVALLLPVLSRAQSSYFVEKVSQSSQAAAGTTVPYTTAPYVFVAGAPLAGTFTAPSPSNTITTLDPVTGGFSYNQIFASQASLDQIYPSGIYTFSTGGQTIPSISLTGDAYPPAPQITNGTWNSSGQLVIDPTTNYAVNFNSFTGYSTGGVQGAIQFIIQDASGNAPVNTEWSSTTTPDDPTGATIPAGTLTAGSTYTGTLLYATDTVNDTTSVPGSVLSGIYASLTTFTILTQSSSTSGGGGGGGGSSGGGTALVATSQPASETVASGSTVAFAFVASGSPAPTYQWFFNNVALTSATSGTLVISGATAANAGTYTCTATNSSGSLTSNPAMLAIISTPNPGHLVNLSTRAVVGTGSNILIVGFAVGGGSGNEPLLIRASGPALATFNVPGTLPDPQLQLYSGSTVLATNNGWAGDATIATEAAAVGAFAWTSPTSHDSALATSLGAGSYTAQVAGQSHDTGVALAEVYDATAAGSFTASSPRLVNLSARVTVGTGGNILIAGFVIGGSTSETVLIRASGPALVPFGVAGTLPDPALKLFSGSTVLAANSGWGGDPNVSAAAASVGAFTWGSPTSNDSAILVTLPPGAYTAEVAGASNDTGIALVEVYEVP
jgi:hypothetical protein